MPRIGNADDEVTLGHVGRDADLIGGRFVDADNAADGAFADLRRFAGNLQPSAAGLLDGEGRGKLHHVGGGLGGTIIGGNDEIF